MKKLIYSFLAVFLFQAVVYSQGSVTYTSLSDGDWDDPTIWTPAPPTGESPGYGDIVYIDHIVTFDYQDPANPLEVLSIFIGADPNAPNLDPENTKLIAIGTSTLSMAGKAKGDLVVSGELILYNFIVDHQMEFTINETGSVTVGGTFDASNNNAKIDPFTLNGSFNVDGTIDISGHPNCDVTGSGCMYGGTFITDNNTIFDVSNPPSGTSICGFTKVWTGATSTDWFVSSNWNPASVPLSGESITIPDVVNNNDPIVNLQTPDATAVAYGIDLEAGAVLTINSSGKLTCNRIINGTGINGVVIKSTADGTGSLICEPDPAGENLGTVERYAEASRWNMVTPSTTGVTGQTFFDADPQDSWLARFDETVGTGSTIGAGWIYMPVLTDNVYVGQGYTYFPDNNNEVVPFKGTLQTINLSPAITWSNASFGYNAVGNCFTSALQWNTNADWVLTNVEGTIWIWDGTTYQAYTQAVTHDIPVGQGFFVRALAGTPSITLPASQRNHNDPTFLKNTENGIGEYENALIIKAENNQAEDKVQISFGDNGTESFDNGWDGTKLFGNEDTPQLYLVEQGTQQSYDHLPTLVEEQNTTVAMSYIPGVDGSQTLIADLSYFTNANVSLEDLKTGTTQNLRDNNVYAFMGSKADIPERFLLHFAYSPNGIGNVNENASSINIYANENDIYIRSNNSNIQQGTVYVYDLMGREILQQAIGNSELVKITVNLHNAYAIVKVVKDGFEKTEKVFVK